MSVLHLTKHSRSQMSFRKISERDIETCLSFGDVIHKTGIEFHIISKKVIKTNQLPEKLHGLCVLVDSNNLVITTYKNTNAISNTKRLSKDNLKKFFN